MRINDIFESTEQYHIRLANKIPHNIKSIQELFDVGYRIAVKDLGLTEARSLDRKFAVNLVNAYSKQQLDEGVASALGKAAGWTAGAVGAAGRKIGQAWDDAKAGYAAGKAKWNPTASPASGGSAPASGGSAPTAPAPTAPASGGSAPAPTAPASGGSAPASSAPATAPQVSPYKQVQSLITKLDKKGKQRILASLQKELGVTPAAPAPAAAPAAQPAQDTSARLAQIKSGQTAQNQANSALRQQQVAQTTAANAQSAQADTALVAAVKAAKAKPGFQQTAQDKLTIKQGAEKGIRESKKKKKKAVAEFKSNFLGRMI